VEVCENPNSDGFVPDNSCISHTMVAGENFTFSFVNRKTTPPPVIVSVTQLNDVDAGQFSANFHVTTQIAAGHTGTLTIAPAFGKMSPSDGPTTGMKTFRVAAGTNTTPNLTYYAPTEVPPGNSDVPPGKDKIVVTLVDDQTHVSATPSWQVFTINPSPSGGGCCEKTGINPQEQL
jgi:hypothetical protein